MNIDSMQSRSQDGATNVDAMHPGRIVVRLSADRDRRYNKGNRRRTPRLRIRPTSHADDVAGSHIRNNTAQRKMQSATNVQRQATLLQFACPKKLVQCAMMAMTQNTRF